MPGYTLKFTMESPLHDRLKKRIVSRIELAKKGHTKQYDAWSRAENKTLAFVHETTEDAARRNSRDMGDMRYTTIQIPYSYAMLMSSHTYWTSVFFARNPIHQFAGRHGEGEMQVQAVEALISYQVEVGSFLGPYYVWLYDAGKYGCGILGHYWCVEKLHYGDLVEMQDPNDPNAPPQLMQTTKEIQGYVGNRVYNISPWDFMHDPRVALRDFQKGEFCVVRCRLGWNDILRRRDAGYYNQNVDRLRGHLTDKGRAQSESNLVRPQFDLVISNDFEDEQGKHPSGATFYEVYVDLIPSEWGVGSTNFPQKWCFTITEDYGVIVGASPLGLAHCKFPIDVLQSEVEGYGLYTRGIPEIMDGVQNTIDWLLNTHFYNVRASLNNQFIVDPSKIVLKDVQNSGAGFVWRLRPEAYGSDISKIFMQVPVTDITRSHLSDYQMMLGVGEKILGVNDQIMGALSAGGRKTATEVRTSTGFGVNRQKTITEYMSNTGFGSHAQSIVMSTQQFYDAQQKIRRVGDLVLDAGDKFLNVTPEDIVGQFDLVPVDGTLPIDRMAQANLWKEIMASVKNMPPQVSMGYDWMRIFGWAAQLGGLKNIQQFKVQVVPDQQIAQQQQAGNVVPMMPPNGPRPMLPSPGPAVGGVAPGNSASGQAGLHTLPGVGGLAG